MHESNGMSDTFYSLLYRGSGSQAEQTRTRLDRMHGLNQQIWARYEFTVPAQLAGTNPNHSGLDAITLVRGLTLRNRHNGLPADSLRYVSHHWDLLNARGNSGGPLSGELQHRLCIWVELTLVRTVLSWKL